MKLNGMKKRYISIIDKNQYLTFTFIFLTLLPIVFFPFIREGKSFVWSTDGISQHYPSLIYYGRLLRDILSGKGFPMVDYSIGLGFDTITTLHYYILGDPIGLFAVFVTEKNSVLMYNLLILFRMYLVGISFITLCRYFNKRSFATIMASLIYVFSGYALYAGLRHPYFLNPMIFLPLIIMGLEKVLKKEKPYLLIIISFLCSISNFYFLYYISIMAVIYCIFRYCTVYHTSSKQKILGLLCTGLKVGGYYLLGIAMSAIILVPILYTFTLSGRLDGDGYEAVGMLHYSKKYYLTLAQGFFATGVSPGFWVRLSFPSLLGVSLTIMMNRKKHRQFTIGFILLMMALCIPVFGKVMNGFSYVSNRWSFAIALFMAMLFVYTYEELQYLKKRDVIVCIVGCFMYAVITLGFPSNKAVHYELIILIISVLTILSLQLNIMKRWKMLSNIAIFIVVYVTIAFHGYGYYANQFYGYVDEFLTEDEVRDAIYGNVVNLSHHIEDDSFYRVETSGDKTLNEGMAQGFYDVSAYFSLMDGNVTKYLKNLEILSQRNAYRFHDLDNRTILNTLSSVKYMLTSNKSTAPYGYELYKEVQQGEETYYIFENKLALPLGYVYDDYMLEEDYEKLSVLEKQNAMLYSVILEEDSTHINKTMDNMSAGIKKLDATITVSDGVVLKKNQIKVTKPNSKMVISFNGDGVSETYVRIKNLDIMKKSSAYTTLRVKGENEITKNLNMRNKYHTSYFGKENFLINLGYSRSSKSKAIITFPKKETFSFDEIEVLSLDMRYTKNQVKKLQENVLQEVEVKSNKVTGYIHLDNKKIMVFAIPYSIGWNAYVNGEKVDLVRANGMYMALNLEKGSNTVVLTYRTPYLVEGSILSLLGFTGFALVIWWNKKARNKGDKIHGEVICSSTLL